MKNGTLVILLLSVSLTSSQGQNMPLNNGELPLDDIAVRKIHLEKRVLNHPPLRENDILWEKRVWRLIDTREKINLPFRYPNKYFFEILTEGIKKGAIQAYSPENDAFQYPLRQQEALKDLVTIDTIPVFVPDAGEEELHIVENLLDPARILRFRVKEVWYFDKKTSTLKVRILGIAPMIMETDEMGNFKYERPMFWVYYPDCREWLSRHEYFLEGNDNRLLSWEDLFEMRRFSSYITKGSNVLDERLEDQFSGLDRLIGAARIDQEIFNFEGYLWSY